ncbi:helicase-associated domain-containing protein [Sanguibacter sp. 4.1]|uniref:Helicase-associated domain-containing protein n=1 Tax=Sanguibacter biliveldensis TaxID=3030830 RepID=A0AAF0Z4D5_9MICO|nr:helicase-associated domain-containing protein [Sanguibacter sp. 4.1]WPF81774.1 helicase-associated domain-containing protein [Sanguibacter sp. 4.1]
MVTFSDSVRARDDARLVALLSRRPDLASPSPSTLLSLAARAMSRASVHRAVVSLDVAHLEVLEAVYVLETIGDEATDERILSAVLGSSPEPDDADRLAQILADLDESALLWRPTPTTYRTAPGVDEVQDTFPAGLGPSAAGALTASGSSSGTSTTSGRSTTAAAGASTSATSSPGPAPQTDWSLAVTPEMHEALASAPAGARSILAALTWGPPVGRMPSTADGPTAAPTRWLLEHGFVRKADAHHVLLPREVALALREGRTHRGLSTPPQLPPATLDPATVEAESARAAQEITRLVADLVALWQETPAATLRSGGLGVRDLRRLGLRLEVDERTAAFVVELAAMAGLVVDDGDDPASYAPTLDADDWLADDLPRRWTTLVTAWHSSARTPWLVGSRDERGALRSALEPELHRAWVPRLRSEVLGVLHAAPGAPVTADQITAVLRWRAPRAVPPHEAVDALLVESALLGVTGAGALSAAGAVLAGVPVLTVADDAARTALASAMGAALPEAVDDLLLQGDQTGIVPGRPSPALEALLADSAVVESRGSAITVRFTPESVTRALDAGRTGEELLAELAVHSRSGVPQPLEYLVRDAARRHGQLRLGAASAYVRVEDPVLLAGLVEDPRLRGLGLFRIAPTVLASSAAPSQLLAALRERGLAPAMEGPDGQVVHADRRTPRVRLAGRRGRRRAPGVDGSARAVAPDRPDRLQALVAVLRRGEEQARAAQAAGTTQPNPTAPGAASGGRAATTSAPGRTASPGRTAGGGVSAGRGRSTDRSAPPSSASASTDPSSAPAGQPGEGTTEPVVALALLREAAADGREVLVDIVGPSGDLTRRRLRPTRLDAGRLRAVDVARESELTVAVHRIANVEPIPGAP